MARGGIYDQVGGGFARYAVDATWTVPHFEKMLYDNALLARAYLHGWQVSGDERFCGASAARRSTGRCARCAAPRAVSAPRSTPTPRASRASSTCGPHAELRDVLGSALYDDAIAYFGAASRFEDALRARGAAAPSPPACRRSARRLLGARAERVRPGLDDKRLTSWNALMISALAEAGAVLERADYLEAAIACAPFVLRELRDADGRLLRSWKDGRGTIPAYLEDYAFLLEALIDALRGDVRCRAGIARR